MKHKRNLECLSVDRVDIGQLKGSDARLYAKQKGLVGGDDKSFLRVNSCSQMTESN